MSRRGRPAAEACVMDATIRAWGGNNFLGQIGEGRPKFSCAYAGNGEQA
jgi:hypothetical protein